MSTPVPRAMVSCYVRRFGGWTPLRKAIASQLGIGADDVVDLDSGGAPPVYIQARTQHGEFEISLELFIDPARVGAYRTRMALLLGLSRALGEEILCDDGLSSNPYRWVLVKPDGTRYEVFEASNQEAHVLALDRGIEPRLIYDDAFFESRQHLPRTQRALEELEWEMAQGQLKLAIALDTAQNPGPEGFARFSEWERDLRAEIERRKAERACG